MTQCQQIVDTFRRRGWKATLGDLLEEGRFGYAHKLTARLSDLRKQGYKIDCTPGPNPSKNLYVMTPPPPSYQFDPLGQGILV